MIPRMPLKSLKAFEGLFFVRDLCFRNYFVVNIFKTYFVD